MSGSELPAGLGAALGGSRGGGGCGPSGGGGLLARAGGDWRTCAEQARALLLGLRGGVLDISGGGGLLACEDGDWRAWTGRELLLGLGRVGLAGLGWREGEGDLGWLLASAGRVGGGLFSVLLLSLVLLVS